MNLRSCVTSETPESSAGKAEIRSRVRLARADQDPATAARRDEARTSRVLAACRRLNPGWIACYVSVDPEPSTSDLLAELADWGVGILLPWLGRGSHKPSWAEWAGEPMTSGFAGIPMPTSPRLDATALSRADLIVLPGLAGTREGVRLGQGGGWYDQALAHARPDTPRWLLLNDAEVVAALPHDPWDQPVTALVTERRWIECGGE